MKIILPILCCLSIDLRARMIDISLTDSKSVEIERVRARVRWFEDQGVGIESVTVANVPGAYREIRKSTETLGIDDRTIESLVLNVHERDPKQKYALGGLGVLTKDGPDDALRFALEPLVGRISRSAHVVIVSPSLRKGKFADVKPRVAALMNFLGATDGSCTIVPRTPKAPRPRNPHASAIAALATFAGLVPLSLLTSWFPIHALPIYAEMATGLVGVDRHLVSEGARAALKEAVIKRIVAPAWRVRLRSGEVYWAESVYLVRGFASIRACAEGLAGKVRGRQRGKD